MFQPPTIEGMAAAIAAALSAHTGKTFAVRSHDSIPLSSEASGNEDGLFRLVVPTSISWNRLTFGGPINLKRQFSVLYYGDLAGAHPWVAANEIDNLILLALTNDEVITDNQNYLITSASTITGAEVGYSFDDAEKNIFIGGFTITVEY